MDDLASAVSELPFQPDAVIRLAPPLGATLVPVLEPLLRTALDVRYGPGAYDESAYYLHLAAILERQELMPTAMEGVALAYPDHASAIPIDRAGIQHPIVVVGLCEAGFAWAVPRRAQARAAIREPGDAVTVQVAAAAAAPVRVVFLILSGGDPGPDLILKSRIARWARRHLFVGMSR